MILFFSEIYNLKLEIAGRGRLLDNTTKCTILKFADDTKLFRNTKEIGDKQKLQDDINKLVRWN